MKRTYEKWANLMILGEHDLDTGNLEKATAYYNRALVLAERLITDTMLHFDGDSMPLQLYNHTGCCLVQLHLRLGDTTAARQCLVQTGQTFLAILNNVGYPPLMRGKAIRQFEPLMNLAIQFYQQEGQPQEACTLVDDWLTAVKRCIAHMRPLDEMAALN